MLSLLIPDVSFWRLCPVKASGSSERPAKVRASRGSFHRSVIVAVMSDRAGSGVCASSAVKQADWRGETRDGHRFILCAQGYGNLANAGYRAYVAGGSVLTL